MMQNYITIKISLNNKIAHSVQKMIKTDNLIYC